MPPPPVQWHRFVLLKSADWLDLVELAVAESTLYVRRRSDLSRGEARDLDHGSEHAGYGTPARERELASPEAAAEAMAEQVARLRGEGYHEDSVRLGPPPEPALLRKKDRASETRWRDDHRAEGRARFDEGLPRFCDDWVALGHDPRLPFHEAAKRKLAVATSLHDLRRAANDLADRCVHLAEQTFGVFFARRTTTFDEEHGTRQSIGRAWLASFYESPVGVLVIARCKLSDQCKHDDDADAPGLADELRACLDQRLGPLPPAPIIALPLPAPAAPPKPRQSRGDPLLADAIRAHLRRRAGPAADPYLDEDARWVKLDVLFTRPSTPENPIVFSTTGMAERPLAHPSATRTWTELELRVPAGSPAAVPEPPKKVAGKRKPQALPPWPVVWLQQLARKPHQDGEAFRAGDIVALPAPGASPFEGALLLPSDLLPDLSLVGRTVTFLTVCPLHASELAHGRDHGAESLLEAFRARGVDPRLLDPGRAAIA